MFELLSKDVPVAARRVVWGVVTDSARLCFEDVFGTATHMLALASSATALADY